MSNKESNKNLSQAEKELLDLYKRSGTINLSSPGADFRKERIEDSLRDNGDSSLLAAFEEPYLEGVNNVVWTLNKLIRDYHIKTTEQLIDLDVQQVFGEGTQTTKLLKAMQKVLEEKGQE